MTAQCVCQLNDNRQFVNGVHRIKTPIQLQDFATEISEFGSCWAPLADAQNMRATCAQGDDRWTPEGEQIPKRVCNQRHLRRRCVEMRSLKNLAGAIHALFRRRERCRDRGLLAPP